jgi:cellulose synthase/poly-beta-1,6-N-acetylglucosamine synthase-like glycosyltransferase
LIATLWLCPAAHLALVVVNFATSVVVLALQALVACLRRVAPPRRTAPVRGPFVSIQVPAHDEPPAVLIETLRHLARLEWPSYEVLVIDNNTSDPERWRPVEGACRELGPRFRFVHIEGIAGAKAGALNWARQFIDPRAEYAFIVDADYQVRPDCLRRAFAHVTDRRTALVQFPQHYRNVTRDNAALALEFRHFFASYMHAANRLGCVPSTGTLTLIDLDALRTVGGFDTSIITEDAELGFRLLRRGYRAIFVDEPVGAGLLPLDLAGLKKQRWRWAFGNAQVLRGAWRELLFGRALTRRQKLGCLSHMTAWFNFNLIPSLSLVFLAIAAATGRLAPSQHAIIFLSAATLASFLALRFVTVAVGLRRDGNGWRAVLAAFVTHLGLGWIFSSSWISCLWDRRSRFVRTNKFIAHVVPGQLRWMMTELATGVLLLAACASMAIADLVAGPLAALAFAAIRFGIVWVLHQARATYEITARQVETRRAAPEEANAA